MKHLPQYFIFLLLLTHTMSAFSQIKPTVWKLNNTVKIGGISPIVIGDPKPENDDGITSLNFNGESDGILLPVNPVHDLKKFTVEVLF
jgi:hypothetical protein